MSFWTGTPGKYEQRSLLRPDQEAIYQNQRNAIQGRGAGGAFGQSADYYRDLLSDDNSTFDAFAAPEMRRYNEKIIPDLAEQFAGMGAGALSSSGFRNAGIRAGTDLSERLGAIRAQLRNQGAQGLQNIGQNGLNQYSENIYTQGQPGFLDYAAPIAGAVGGSFFGPAGTAAGASFGKKVGDWFSQKGSTSPYGGPSSPDQNNSWYDPYNDTQ
jgi:hypothetical protein